MLNKIYCYKEDKIMGKLFLKCLCGNDFTMLKTYKHEKHHTTRDLRYYNSIVCQKCNRNYNIVTFEKIYPTPDRSVIKPNIINCPACQGKVSNQAKSCPHCGQPINTKITCAKCNSTEIENIGGFKKGASAVAFGVFAANTILNNYKCLKCGHKFK